METNFINKGANVLTRAVIFYKTNKEFFVPVSIMPV
jgi:hypothetical protein